MALKIVWTKRAQTGFSKIIDYLDANFSEREIRNFVRQSQDFFDLLAQHPEMLEESRSRKGLFRGPMNKHTILTYRVDRRKNQIQLINIRPARMKPLK